MPLAWADVSGLTGGKIQRLPAEFCVFTVFFVSGFWHGNTLPFVIWGLLQACYRLGEELMHRRFGKPKKKAPAKTLWAKRAGVFVLWTISMVFFCVGMSGAAYNGFYANTIMVAAYYAFVVVTLALGFALDARRAFTYKNKPSEICLANEKHRWGIYYVLVICLLVGYIMQNGGFGGASGFGMYANF